MSTYGMVSALFFSSCSVGAFIGPSAGGYLLDNFGYRWSSMYIVLLDAIMIILFVLYKLQQKYSNSELSKRERLISTGSLVKNRCYSQSVHSVA
jgi:MFS family permease